MVEVKVELKNIKKFDLTLYELSKKIRENGKCIEEKDKKNLLKTGKRKELRMKKRQRRGIINGKRYSRNI